MKSLCKIAFEIWPNFSRFWLKFGYLNLTRSFGYGYLHLGHLMSLIRLYLGTNCEVCGSNWQWDMNTESLNVQFKGCSWLIWALNLNFKHIIRIPARCFTNTLSLKWISQTVLILYGIKFFFQGKAFLAGRLFVTWSPGFKRDKKKSFLIAQKNCFHKDEWKQRVTIFTPTWNRGGVIFSLQFVCLSGSACEQNSSKTDAPIWTRFLLYGCLTHWLKPYWNWWPWFKGQGHSDSICFFLHNSLLTFLLYFSTLLSLIKLKF